MQNSFPNDDPSAAAQAARLCFINPHALADADPHANSPIVGITLRVPAIMIARIAVLARAADISRNAMAQLVIRAGLEGIVTHLPVEFVHELDEAATAEHLLTT